jgi:hypothetical protein
MVPEPATLPRVPRDPSRLTLMLRFTNQTSKVMLHDGEGLSLRGSRPMRAHQQEDDDDDEDEEKQDSFLIPCTVIFLERLAFRHELELRLTQR